MALGNNGYVSIYRKLQDSFLWGRSDWLAAWLDLLLTANWKDGQQTVAGQVVNVPRGSLVASERFLQERWAQWGFETRKAVRYLLSLMDREGMILRHKQGPRVTLITICNYEAYQDQGAESGPRKAHERPTKGPKINKGIREEELQPPLVGLGADGSAGRNGTASEAESFARFWSAYPRKVGKANAEKAWTKTADSRPPLDDLLQRLEALKASTQWKRDGGQFVPHPATWLNRGGWEDEPENAPPSSPRAHGWHPNPAEDFQ